jgi:hypothetical protein
MLSLEPVAFQTWGRFAARGPVTQFHLKEMTVCLVCFLTPRQQNTVPLNLLLSLKMTTFFLYSPPTALSVDEQGNTELYWSEGDGARGLSWCSTSVVGASCGSREICCVTSRVPTVGKGLKLNGHCVPVHFDSGISVWGRPPCCYQIARISVSVLYTITGINDADNSAVCNYFAFCQMWPFSEELILKMY